MGLWHIEVFFTFYSTEAWDCYIKGDRLSYTGTLNVTRTGEVCLPWANYPHLNGLFPEVEIADAENFCRNPSYYERPWCYVKTIVVGSRRTVYCDVPLCTGTVARALLTWWSHEMTTFSALLALCEGNPPVTGGFPSQGPVTGSFVDLRLNKRLSKQSKR